MHPCFSLMAAAVAALLISGCGDPTAKSPAPGAPPAAAKSPSLKSIENQRGDYTDFVMAQRVDDAGWQAYLGQYARLVAALPAISDQQLATAAFPELAAEPDPFKREELFATRKAQLETLRREATPRVRLVVPGRVFVGQYQMETETYELTFDQGSEEYRMQWTLPKDRPVLRVLRYCLLPDTALGCRGSFTMKVKVAKDRARVIEADLARLGIRELATGVYASARAFAVNPNTQLATDLQLDVHAVSLHRSNPQNSWQIDTRDTVLFIDGPALAQVP